MLTDKERFEEVIARLPQEFDSHEFIRLYQLSYPLEFADKIHNEQRLKDVTSKMARKLSEWADDLHIVKQPDNVLSDNIKNLESLNTKWRKGADEMSVVD
mgnify:FL=1